MKTIQIRQKSGNDGILHLEVPVGAKQVVCDVRVTVDPQSVAVTWLPDVVALLQQGWQGEPQETVAEWEQELDRRWEEIANGKEKGVSAAEAIARLRRANS